MLKSRPILPVCAGVWLWTALAWSGLPADHWVREAVQKLSAATSAQAVRKAIEELPAALQRNLAEADLKSALQIEAVLQTLAGADDARARSFASRAAATCGTMAPGGRDTTASYLAKVGACLQRIAEQAATGASNAAVRTAVQRVVNAARQGARAMRAALLGEIARLRREAPKAAPVFTDDLVATTREDTDAEARRFHEAAQGCVRLRREPSEPFDGYVARMGSCLAGAAQATSVETRVREVRRSVAELVAEARRGIRDIEGTLERLSKRLHRPVTIEALFPSSVTAALAKAPLNVSRAFAQAARPCGALARPPTEELDAWVKRVADCLVEAAESVGGESVDTTVQKALAALAAEAQKGGASVQKGLDAALKLLTPRVNDRDLFPEALRMAFLSPTPVLGVVVVRAARRCGGSVRGPHEKPADFVRRVGNCLARGVAEAEPKNIAATVLRAVNVLVAGAKGGVAAFQKALHAADALIRGKVNPAEVFPPSLRGGIASATAAWAARFAKLAPTCAGRKFKPHHNLPEFLVRTGLCLQSAALGITQQAVEGMMRASIRTLATAARKGARDLRVTLGAEVAKLERIMRVNDLYPEDWRKSVVGLHDASAKAFGVGAAACAALRRPPSMSLGELAKALSACLLKAVGASGGDMLVSRVREAVQVLVRAAKSGAAGIRASMPSAIDALKGLVDHARLFTEPLRKALARANDALADAFARQAPSCVEQARPQGTRFEPYVEEVAGCLVRIATKVRDERRRAKVRAAIEELAGLGQSGPAQLLAGYPAWRTKYLRNLKLPFNLVSQMTFTLRTSAFVTRLRVGCAKLPASTPTEVRKVADCIVQAAAYANRFQPPDACRGKSGDALFDCCMASNNRRLPSCAQHRFSCRPGETYQNDSCVKQPCPPGMVASGAGTCTRLGCPPGQRRDAAGNCVTVACATAGATVDALGYCVTASCPPGSAPDALGRCFSAGCPLGMVRNVYGQCQGAICPGGGAVDAMGRCLQRSCPVGMAMDAAQRCVPVMGMVPAVPAPMPGMAVPVAPTGMAPLTCAVPGALLEPATNRCLSATCPAGTMPDAFNRCLSPGCPFGFVRNVFNQCQRAVCPGGVAADAMGRCVQYSCPMGMGFDATRTRCLPAQ